MILVATWFRQSPRKAREYSRTRGVRYSCTEGCGVKAAENQGAPKKSSSPQGNQRNTANAQQRSAVRFAAQGCCFPTTSPTRPEAATPTLAPHRYPSFLIVLLSEHAASAVSLRKPLMNVNASRAQLSAQLCTTPIMLSRIKTPQSRNTKNIAKSHRRSRLRIGALTTVYRITTNALKPVDATVTQARPSRLMLLRPQANRRQRWTMREVPVAQKFGCGWFRLLRNLQTAYIWVRKNQPKKLMRLNLEA
mmetsp:Transcript_50906/g.143295  ORF Transcript_50906/g.143295 Transcript_50906/m.143295 type:complete len:249 (-) Transcript_50906:466-1212(-)